MIKFCAIATGAPEGILTGFTAEQVAEIVAEPIRARMRREQAAKELRDRLNALLAERKLPAALVQDTDGKWKTILYDREKEAKI